MTGRDANPEAIPDAIAAAVQSLVLVCERACRTYGTGPTVVVAVHDATCQVGTGDRIAITGASGSGKSTLLHLMAGLEPTTAGTVAWPALGATPITVPGTVGVVFQGPSLIPALDVLENVALPLVLAGSSDRAARDVAAAALERIGVADLSARLPEELSGGQAQRVAVARVLAGRPRLILADEPTGQLDHTIGARVVDVLLQAADELGASLVVATHDRTVAERMDQRWPMRSARLYTAARPTLGTDTAVGS